MTEVLIPARQGRAVRVPRGAAIDVINTHGTQVVDFWALCWPNTSEHLSMEHTRIAIGRLAIMSACPQDLTPVNGAAQRPVDAHFHVHRPGADDDG